MRVFILPLLIVMWVLTAVPVRAQTMISPNYKIRFGNFNMTSGLRSSASYSLTDTVGQTAADLFTSSGYTLKAGFQYMYTLHDFTFSISDLTIDLGSLSPNSFQTATNNLIVTAPGQGYTVSTYETTRLKRPGTSDFIPNTTCNSGCTETSAGVWTSTSSVGFGYNATGHDTASDFTNSTYFRPFPDASLGDIPAPVMSSIYAGRDRTATVTYKANIAGDQEPGEYETSIIFIATPVY